MPFIVTAGADTLDGGASLPMSRGPALALLGIDEPAEMTGRSLLG